MTCPVVGGVSSALALGHLLEKKKKKATAENESI